VEGLGEDEVKSQAMASWSDRLRSPAWGERCRWVGLSGGGRKAAVASGGRWWVLNLNLGGVLLWANLNLSPARGEAKVGLWRVLARMRLPTLHKAKSAGEEPGDGFLVRPFAVSCLGRAVPMGWSAGRRSQSGRRLWRAL
jgi:hypothetical protein